MDPFAPAPIKPTISLADLEKIDVRVGTIVSAVPERVIPNGVRAG